jgi:hypothetical protein
MDRQVGDSGPPSSCKQQNNPANKRERSNGRRNEVAVCGRDMHPKKFDGLSGRFETQTRIGEHHNAQRDEQNRDYGSVHTTFLPEMTRNKMTTMAMTSRMCTKPPIVAPLTRPSNHRTIRTRAMVYNISFSLVWTTRRVGSPRPRSATFAVGSGFGRFGLLGCVRVAMHCMTRCVHDR